MTPTAATHTWQVRVTWGDCDPAGIVFYPRYYAWFDASTHNLLRELGLGHAALRRDYDAIGATLVKTSAEFRSPARYDDVIDIASTIARVGRSSFSVRHVITLGGRAVCEGEEVRVWAVADEAAGNGMRAAPLPDRVRALMTGTANALHAP